MTTGTLALILFSAILAQVAVALLIGLYRRKRQYRDLETHADERQPAGSPIASTVQPETAEADNAPATWEGFKTFVVQRRMMEDRAETVCSFYLVPEDGRPLPLFKPGQFLTFKLTIENPATGETENIVRCYSLSDSPKPDYYRVTIKRVPPPPKQPELPPGRSSNYFHDHVQEGARLSVKAPSGHFHLMVGEPLPVVLVAGGIGITPMLSIANTLLERGSPREIWLFYGVRGSADQALKAHLEYLQRTYTHFHLHVCYSRPGGDDKEGIDYQHRGHADLDRLRLTLPLKRYQFYICGPRAMMESLVPALAEWGVSSDDICYESFGPASLPKPKKSKPQQTGKPVAAQQSMTVTFGKSGKSLPWNPDAESLLEFAEDNGIEVDFGCRAGSCGSCQAALESGDVEYSQEPDAETEEGCCLLCISKPKSDLTLGV